MVVPVSCSVAGMTVGAKVVGVVGAAVLGADVNAVTVGVRDGPVAHLQLISNFCPQPAVESVRLMVTWSSVNSNPNVSPQHSFVVTHDVHEEQGFVTVL